MSKCFFSPKAGGALASFISGMLIHHTGRWDVVFYFIAVVLVIWLILFVSTYERKNMIFYDQPCLFQ